MKVVALFMLLLITSISASANLCSDETHWSSLNKAHYALAAQFHGLLRALSDDQIKINPSAFLHRQYTNDQYTSFWDLRTKEDRQQISDILKNYKTGSEKLSSYISKMEGIVLQGHKVEQQTKQLMLECKPEKESYTYAKSNHQLTLTSLNGYTRQLNALHSSVNLYQKDIDFLQRILKDGQNIGKRN